jgi:hypothetical protein
VWAKDGERRAESSPKTVAQEVLRFESGVASKHILPGGGTSSFSCGQQLSYGGALRKSQESGGVLQILDTQEFACTLGDKNCCSMVQEKKLILGEIRKEPLLDASSSRWDKFLSFIMCD